MQKTVIDEDFEDGIPAVLASDGVTQKDGAMLLSGAGSIISSGLLPIDADDYQIQLRLRQNQCTASKNGAFSLAVSIDEENKVFDRFVYADTDGAARDRLELSYSDSQDHAGYWHKLSMSEELGRLDRDTRKTDSFEITCEKKGDMLYARQGDKTISSKSETLAMRSGKNRNSLKLTAHSAEISVEHLSVHALSAVSSIVIESDPNPTAGQVCDFWVFGRNQSGKCEIFPGSYQLTYDSDAVTIKDSRIIIKKPGNTYVKAAVTGIDGHRFETVFAIHADSPIGGIHLNAPRNVLLGKTYPYRIEDDAGEEIICDSITGEGLDFSDGQFTANTPGEHTVTIQRGDETAETSIYVSEYEKLELIPKKTNAALGEEISLSLFGIRNGKKTEITADELQYDPDKIAVSGQKITLKKYGKSNITAVYQGILVSAEFTAIQPDAGEIFLENFESEKQYDSFLYDPDKISKKGGSRALMMQNERVVIDTEGAADYEISGRFFVAATNSSAFLPYFGIEVHEESQPVLCSVGEYMRIGCVSGEERFSLQNGSWHTFSVKTVGREVAFTIDQTTRTAVRNTAGSGNIAFYAEGMKIFLDDIRYARITDIQLNTNENNTIRDAESLKNTVRKRRGDFAIYLLEKSKEMPEIDENSQLASLYARMMLQPEQCDYTELLRWQIRHTEYSEKFLGAANGSGDFSLLQAIRSYFQLKGVIRADDSVFEEMKDYLKHFSYPEEGTALSENHQLVYAVCKQLGAEITNSNPDAEEELMAFFRDKLEHGFMEVQSPHYMVVNLYALETLWQFTENARLKQAAYDMAALIYAMQLTDSLDGSIAGACTREYASYGNTMTYLPNTLMFGDGAVIDENYPVRNLQLSGLVFSDYLPPDILFEIAAGRSYPYEYQTKSRVYSFPFDTSITEASVRYSYLTEKYALGSLIHTDSLEKYKSSDGTYPRLVAGIQEIPWSFSISGAPNCLLLESHPGTSTAHASFSGDLNCLCGKYFQERNVSVGMHEIRNSGELQYTHMLIPKKNYDQFSEEQGWIFLAKNGVYLAIRPLAEGTEQAYTWVSDLEIRQNAQDTAFICEVADESYETLAAFKQDILEKTRIEYKISDEEYMLCYQTTDGRRIKLDYRSGSGFVDDVCADFADADVIASPYVTCSGGIARLIYQDKSYEVRLK